MNLNQMKRIASKSDHKLYLHASLIYAGSRLLVQGYNKGEKHAEIVAISRLQSLIRNSRKPKNLHMINLMVKRRTGTFGKSFPCEHCRMAMRIVGIKEVTYFEEEWREYRL